MKDLRSRPVIFGMLVDLIGSFLIGALYFAFLGVYSGATTAEQLTTVYEGSVLLQAIAVALGLLATAAGAYVAATMAPGAERLHAFALGIVSTLFGFLVVFSSPESSPFWAQASSLVLTIPAAFFAGELRRALAGSGGTAA